MEKFPAPRRVTIIFEEFRDNIYNEVERITSDDFDFLGEETKDGGLKINFTIHKGEWKWTKT